MSGATWLVDLPMPPARPACQGQPASLFDATREDDAGPALMCCARCPAEVLAWCADVVDAKRSHFDGVAAGRVYKDGRDVGGLDLQVAS